MSRNCMRPGCDRPAAARMTYDSEALEVWLDELSTDPEPVHEVCDVHASRLTAPRDWTVSDRRTPRPAEELLPSGRPPSTVATTPPPTPAADGATTPSAETAAGPSSTEDAPPGSLLARAFRSTGRRRGASAEEGE